MRSQILEHGVLSSLGNAELYHGFGWDLDLGACQRVAPHASGAMLLTNLPGQEGSLPEVFTSL